MFCQSFALSVRRRYSADQLFNTLCVPCAGVLAGPWEHAAGKPNSTAQQAPGKRKWMHQVTRERVAASTLRMMVHGHRSTGRFHRVMSLFDT